jgi:hypothetical protein
MLLATIIKLCHSEAATDNHSNLYSLSMGNAAIAQSHVHRTRSEGLQVATAFLYNCCDTPLGHAHVAKLHPTSLPFILAPYSSNGGCMTTEIQNTGGLFTYNPQRYASFRVL